VVVVVVVMVVLVVIVVVVLVVVVVVVVLVVVVAVMVVVMVVVVLVVVEVVVRVFSCTKKKLQGCSPPANYIDRATAACRRTPLVGEVSANFTGQRVSRGQRNESPRPLISVF
jgi:hypothetical protein